MSNQIVESKGTTVITDKCAKISKTFIRAMQKNGIAFSLLEQVVSEPKNDYEELYGQSEITDGKSYELFGMFVSNPPEQYYKDMHLETKGDAILEIMNYSLQSAEVIGNTLYDYQNIPRTIMGYHVKCGCDIYRIKECRMDAIYQGFPLHTILSIEFIETVKETSDSNVEIGE